MLRSSRETTKWYLKHITRQRGETAGREQRPARRNEEHLPLSEESLHASSLCKLWEESALLWLVNGAQINLAHVAQEAEPLLPRARSGRRRRVELGEFRGREQDEKLPTPHLGVDVVGPVSVKMEMRHRALERRRRRTTFEQGRSRERRSLAALHLAAHPETNRHKPLSVDLRRNTHITQKRRKETVLSPIVTQMCGVS